MDKQDFREMLDDFLEIYPELFPEEMNKAYQL
jgi:hypothetical protein